MQHLAPSPAPRLVVAVLAVVVRDGAVLLVQRANPPDAGLWGFPGGKVDFGETLCAAATRELFEETGVRAVADGVITALDAHDRAETGVLRHHFVLVAVRCIWQHGTPVAADDALDARWVDINDIKDTEGALMLSRNVAAVARQAAAMA